MESDKKERISEKNRGRELTRSVMRVTIITIIITRNAQTLPFFFSSKANVSGSRAEGINLLKNKCRVRRQAVIKVLTDQSASDSEPAIILTESNEHSKPCSAPNMKGDVICWQLASRKGSRRGERSGGEEERAGRVSRGRRREDGKERRDPNGGAGELWQDPASRHPWGPQIPVLKHRCHCPARKPSEHPTSQRMKMDGIETAARGWAAGLPGSGWNPVSWKADPRTLTPILPLFPFQHCEGSVRFS